MPESRPDEETTRTLYDKLDKAIQDYLKKTAEEQGFSERGDYIANWALVVNYGNLEEEGVSADGYFVEHMPIGMPPHAAKGLLKEGISYIKDKQYEGMYDDDDTDSS
jgi:hypothetical protein